MQRIFDYWRHMQWFKWIRKTAISKKFAAICFHFVQNSITELSMDWNLSNCTYSSLLREQKAKSTENYTLARTHTHTHTWFLISISLINMCVRAGGCARVYQRVRIVESAGPTAIRYVVQICISMCLRCSRATRFKFIIHLYWTLRIGLWWT